MAYLARGPALSGIFAGPVWAIGIGALALLACAVTVFTLTATPD